jgi:hypothetical protein
VGQNVPPGLAYWLLSTLLATPGLGP